MESLAIIGGLYGKVQDGIICIEPDFVLDIVTDVIYVYQEECCAPDRHLVYSRDNLAYC